MNPVLIFTDTDRINIEKNALTKCVPVFQSIYDAFQAIGITVSIQDIATLIGWTKSRGRSRDFLEKYAVDKILDAAGSLTIFPGITLSREMVADMIATKPDVSAIGEILDRVPSLYSAWRINACRINLLSLMNGAVSTVADSDTQIENEFTYYTKTDASAQLATAMFTFCDAINTLETAGSSLTPPRPIEINPDFVSGLVRRANGYGVDVGFIRAYEDMQAN